MCICVCECTGSELFSVSDGTLIPSGIYVSVLVGVLEKRP